jgi:uncharacterized coiled-coil DUF342 family protein
MQKIYNKLAKETPAKRKVKLSKVNDLMDQIKECREEMNQIALQSENALTDVQNALGELRIIQESKIPSLSFDKDELLNQVLDLGIDVPQELNELDQMLVDAETIDADAFDLVSKVEDLRSELSKFML